MLTISQSFCLSVPCRAVSCQPSSCRAMANRAVPKHTASEITKPEHAALCRAVSDANVPMQNIAMPCHGKPCRTERTSSEPVKPAVLHCAKPCRERLCQRVRVMRIWSISRILYTPSPTWIQGRRGDSETLPPAGQNSARDTFFRSWRLCRLAILSRYGIAGFSCLLRFRILKMILIASLLSAAFAGLSK